MEENLLTLTLLVIGGRIVPFFGANAIPVLVQDKHPYIEKYAIISVVSFSS
jgi:uncharacterized protein involved in response to NO